MSATGGGGVFATGGGVGCGMAATSSGVAVLAPRMVGGRDRRQWAGGITQWRALATTRKGHVLQIAEKYILFSLVDRVGRNR